MHGQADTVRALVERIKALELRVKKLEEASKPKPRGRPKANAKR